MQFRIDPKSGNRLSLLGFGCMRLPGSAALREELVVSAVNSGINYFDTAYLYPGNETVLGNILKKHNLRGKVFIADKLPHNKCKNTADFDRLFSESLNRLQTDYIDYYLIHNLGSRDAWERLAILGIREWIAEKKEKGIIREIGFSFHGKTKEFVPMLDVYAWDFCLMQYNYMNENYQAGTAGLKAIHERNMAAIIMEPLLGGQLAQNLPRAARELFNRTIPGRSPAAWAFKWLFDKPEVTVVLSGMNAKEQLAENIDIACNTEAGSLTEEEKNIYGRVCGEISKAYKIPCTGCNYCMPCPSGVNIPSFFNAHNMSYVLGFFSGLQLFIGTIVGQGFPVTGPGACSGCGICLTKCPQSINVPGCLKDVRKHLEPFYVRIAISIFKRFIS